MIIIMSLSLNDALINVVAGWYSEIEIKKDKVGCNKK